MYHNKDIKQFRIKEKYYGIRSFSFHKIWRLYNIYQKKYKHYYILRYNTDYNLRIFILKYFS